jgi:hypothetical protein
MGEFDLNEFLNSAMAAAPPSVIAWLAWQQAKKAHTAVNSRWDEFKQLFEEKYIAQGKAEEQSAEAARKGAVALALKSDAEARK